MTYTNKRRPLIEKEEIERFCSSTKEVLEKIYDRINKEQLKKQHKKQKASHLIAS